jgi:hypothetical protein
MAYRERFYFSSVKYVTIGVIKYCELYSSIFLCASNRCAVITYG